MDTLVDEMIRNFKALLFKRLNYQPPVNQIF
jgi:hypothetical protein